jgi:hypothetical protein
MSSTLSKTPVPAGIPAATFNRVLDEGYGPGAWYGSDLRAAISDVGPATAFRRPGEGRRSIAEIALHHAYWAGEIDRKLTGGPARPFPLEGEDWFELADGSRLSWAAVQSTVEAAQDRLNKTVADIGAGRRESPLTERERFDLVLGITGHAAYHAGQIQLIKKLLG